MPYTFRCDRAEIQRQHCRFPGLYKALYKVIERVDPVRLAFIPNEYDIEVNDIMVNLNECQSADEVRDMVIKVFEFWFGSTGAETLAKETQFHHRIWAIRKKFKVGR